MSRDQKLRSTAPKALLLLLRVPELPFSTFHCYLCYGVLCTLCSVTHTHNIRIRTRIRQTDIMLRGRRSVLTAKCLMRLLEVMRKGSLGHGADVGAGANFGAVVECRLEEAAKVPI